MANKVWQPGDIITAEELNRIEDFNKEVEIIPGFKSLYKVFKADQSNNLEVYNINKEPKYFTKTLTPKDIKYNNLKYSDTIPLSCRFIDASKSYYKPLLQNATLNISAMVVSIDAYEATYKCYINYPGEYSRYSAFNKIEEGIYKSVREGTVSNFNPIEYIIIDTTVDYLDYPNVYVKYDDKYITSSIPFYFSYIELHFPLNMEYFQEFTPTSGDVTITLSDVTKGFSFGTSGELTDEYTYNEYLKLLTATEPPENLENLYNRILKLDNIDIEDIYNDIPPDKTPNVTKEDSKLVSKIDDIMGYIATDDELQYKLVLSDTDLSSKFIFDSNIYNYKDVVDEIPYIYYFNITGNKNINNIYNCTTTISSSLLTSFNEYGSFTGDCIIIYGLYNSESNTLYLYNKILLQVVYEEDATYEVQNTINSENDLSFKVTVSDRMGTRFGLISGYTNNTGMELRIYGLLFNKLKFNGETSDIIKCDGYTALYDSIYPCINYTNINAGKDSNSRLTMKCIKLITGSSSDTETLATELTTYVGDNIQKFKCISDTKYNLDKTNYFKKPNVELGMDLN